MHTHTHKKSCMQILFDFLPFYKRLFEITLGHTIQGNAFCKRADRLRITMKITLDTISLFLDLELLSSIYCMKYYDTSKMWSLPSKSSQSSERTKRNNSTCPFPYHFPALFFLFLSRTPVLKLCRAPYNHSHPFSDPPN